MGILVLDFDGRLCNIPLRCRHPSEVVVSVGVLQVMTFERILGSKNITVYSLISFLMEMIWAGNNMASGNDFSRAKFWGINGCRIFCSLVLRLSCLRECLESCSSLLLN